MTGHPSFVPRLAAEDSEPQRFAVIVAAAERRWLNPQSTCPRRGLNRTFGRSGAAPTCRDTPAVSLQGQRGVAEEVVDAQKLGEGAGRSKAGLRGEERIELALASREHVRVVGELGDDALHRRVGGPI